MTVHSPNLSQAFPRPNPAFAITTLILGHKTMTAKITVCEAWYCIISPF